MSDYSPTLEKDIPSPGTIASTSQSRPAISPQDESVDDEEIPVPAPLVDRAVGELELEVGAGDEHTDTAMDKGQLDRLIQSLDEFSNTDEVNDVTVTDTASSSSTDIGKDYDTDTDDVGGCGGETGHVTVSVPGAENDSNDRSPILVPENESTSTSPASETGNAAISLSPPETEELPLSVSPADNESPEDDADINMSVMSSEQEPDVHTGVKSTEGGIDTNTTTTTTPSQPQSTDYANFLPDQDTRPCDVDSSKGDTDEGFDLTSVKDTLQVPSAFARNVIGVGDDPKPTVPNNEYKSTETKKIANGAATFPPDLHNDVTSNFDYLKPLGQFNPQPDTVKDKEPPQSLSSGGGVPSRKWGGLRNIFGPNASKSSIGLEEDKPAVSDNGTSDGEGKLVKTGPTPSEIDASVGMPRSVGPGGDSDMVLQSMETLRQKLSLWGSQTTRVGDGAKSVDTPIAPTLPLTEMDISDSDGRRLSGHNDNVDARRNLLSSSGDTDVRLRSNSGDSRKSDEDRTKEVIANIIHEINRLSSGDDSVFDTGNVTTAGDVTQPPFKPCQASASPQDASSSSHSQSSRHSSFPRHSSNRSSGISVKETFDEANDTTSKFSPSSDFKQNNENGNDIYSVETENDSNDEDFAQEESSHLLPKNEHGITDGPNTDRSNSDTSMSSGLSKSDRRRRTSDSKLKERPRSGPSALSRFLKMIPLMNSGKEKRRPSSEIIKISSQPIRYESLDEDLNRDGVDDSGSADRRDNDDRDEGGEPSRRRPDIGGGLTNVAFEGETRPTKPVSEDLIQLVQDLSEQLVLIRTIEIDNDTDQEHCIQIQKIKSHLLESLQILQQNFNPTPTNADEIVSFNCDEGQDEEVTPSASDPRGVFYDVSDLELGTKETEKGNAPDNLSLEFFVPGSSKTYRLHRETFFVFVLKYSIFFFSFIFCICGLTGITLGGLMLSRESAIVIDDATDVFLDPNALLCLISGTIFIVAFFGCVGSLRENILLLEIFHLATAVLLILEVLVGAIVFLFFSLPEFRQAAKVGPEEVLKRAVINYFDDKGMKKWIDKLQRDFRCCGTSLTDYGYLDWQENAYFNCSSSSIYSCSVPFSCCVFEKGDFIDYMCGADIMRKEESYVRRYINTTGCMKSFGEWLGENTSIIAYVCVAIVLPQILSIVEARYFNSILRKHARSQSGSDVVYDLSVNSQDLEDESYNSEGTDRLSATPPQRSEAERNKCSA